MSTGAVELIHVRLKEELDRLGLRPSAVAKAIGEPDSQGLRDVLGGRKRLSADLLAAMAATGIDVGYVLTGQKVAAALTTEERLLIERYRESPRQLRDAALRVLLGADLSTGAATQNFHATITGGVAARDIVNKGPK